MSHNSRLLNKHCFMLNSLALGDVIAAVPVIKYMIERYHPTTETYYVVAKSMFRNLLYFVPDKCFKDFDQKDDNWGVPLDFAISCINQKKSPITRGTPKMMTLGQFASIKLADRILPAKNLQYVALPEVDVSSFGLSNKKYVIFVSTYRDETRMWPADSLLQTAAFVKSRGYIPVFIGKTDMNIESHLVPKTSLPENIDEFGVDLRNRTSILELASLMKHAKAVVGLDSGPIHLAGTTDVPIVCAYTSVLAEHRVPNRLRGPICAINADIDCIGCESTWCSHFWNFEKCYLGHADCSNKLTADLFIRPLKKILK